jgi:hypothetical protein
MSAGDGIHTFARMVEKQERAACLAAVLDEKIPSDEGNPASTQAWNMAIEAAAIAIRARGRE